MFVKDTNGCRIPQEGLCEGNLCVRVWKAEMAGGSQSSNMQLRFRTKKVPS